jgi:hypothetical protein
MLMLVVSTALVGGTALLLSSRLADGSVTQWLVGAYVIGFAEIVIVSLALSPPSALSRWPVFGALVGLFAGALLFCRPVRFPPFRAAARSVCRVLRDPTVGVVALVVLGAVAYSIALGLFTAQNEQDALTYHLARAAFWTQQERIGYIPGAQDIRLNSFAPNGEIAMAFTMVTSGTGRYASLVQLTAGLATAVAVCGIARRLGLGLRESVLSGLLFVTLPVVALQLSTGLNDVILASLVSTTAFFLLRGTTANLVLTGVSTALLVGTKLTGILALPGLALVAFSARRHRPLAVLGVGAVAAAVGAYWYAYAHFEAGGPPGSISNERGGQAGVVTVLGRSIRLALAAVELPGAVGLDRLFYVAAAAMLAVIAFRSSGSLRERTTRTAIACGLTLAPLVLVPAGSLALRASRKAFFELGRSDVGNLDADRSATKASPIFSWYGPLGVLLTLLACVLIVRAVRQRQLPAVALVLAAAPFLWIVLLAIAVPYWEWNGRYTMGGFALAAATWAVALRVRPVAWAAAAVAALSVTLAFVHQHDRPSGLRLIEPTAERSVWTEPDWTVQATDHPDLRAVFRFVDREVPRDARLAIQPRVWPMREDVGKELLAYPFFGRDLSRTVLLAESLRKAAAAKADWAILRGQGSAPCVRGWKRVFRYDVWSAFRRVAGCG